MIFANKGMCFETLINQSIYRFNYSHNAFFIKRDLKVKINKIEDNKVSGQLTSKSQADYYGFYQGYYFDFEAKQTVNDYFDLNQIKDHQFNHLKLIANNKGIAFVLVGFVSYQNYFAIKINDLIKYYQQYKKKKISLEWFQNNAITLHLILPGILDFADLVNQLIRM